MDEPKELGTLVVVVGKARNLVNKSRFGKQDPFCTVTYGEDKQKTKSIKRGGQHPEWDEELRFTILEDADDLIARSQSTSESLALGSSTNSIASLSKTDSPGVTTAQALAQRSRKGAIGKKGGKSMRLACYADDAKEPELIGDCSVSIDDVLKKGEVDEWYDILYKEKYTGEVYLELTFYSNDAPPVKRNVPRPSVHNYGGAGVFEAGPSSLPSHHRLSGSISHSGSVSGASLYIPPYVQPSVTGTSTPAPSLNHSSSFAMLGLPPSMSSQQQLSTPPSYPPLSHTPKPAHQLSVDSLTRPLSSLSLASTASAGRPLPTATPAPMQSQQVLHHHPHRHSVGGPNEAPWGSLLPQSQPAPAPTPHPRPSSTNDAVPWQHAQRIEAERRMGGATPVPRPVSGQGYRPPWQQQQPPADPYRGATPVPSIPSALQAGGPPPPPKQIHANSYAGSSHSQNAPAHPYSSPAPDPIPHPNSAPPTSANTHYGIPPASSFGGVAQSLLGGRNSPMPERYVPTPDPNQYYQQTPPRQDFQQQPQYSTPTRQNSYPNGNGHQQYPPQPQPHRNSLPKGPMQQSPPPPTPPRDQYGQQQGYSPAPQGQGGYGYQQSPQSQPAPAAQPVAPGGYVPWYQQTQPPAAAPAPQPDYGQPPSSYSSPPPPVPSQHRPVPNPPAPPKATSGGYYPSDELYLAQQQTQQSQQQQGGWQQNGPPPQSSYGTNPNQAYDAPYGSQESYVPAHTPSPAPAQAPWSPAPMHQRQPSPAPPAHTQGHAMPHRHSISAMGGAGTSGGWQSQAGQGYGRTPSPAPPSQPQQPYYNPPYRSASPQPPPRQPAQQPSYPSQLAPGPTPDIGRSPSPSGGVGGAKQDWRTYMQSLSTQQPSAPNGPAPNGSNSGVAGAGYGGQGASSGQGGYGGPGRSPSPQPPPKDWYTPPPSLPSSIRPPDGWKSTLPAEPQTQQGQHQRWA